MKTVYVQIGDERIALYHLGGWDYEVRLRLASPSWTLIGDDQPSIELLTAALAVRASLWPHLSQYTVAEYLAMPVVGESDSVDEYRHEAFG